MECVGVAFHQLAAVLLLVAGAVFSFIYGGMQEDKYKIWKYNRDNNPDPEAKRRLNLAGTVSGIIMLEKWIPEERREISCKD